MKTMFKRTLTLGLVAAIAVFASAQDMGKDIVQTAVDNGHFKTLVSLVKKAELVETLQGTGPFTVLAPNDKAFKKVLSNYPKVGDALMSNQDLLKKVLLYHVIAGKVKAADLKDGMKVKTVEGEMLTVHIRHSSVFFNNSKVIKADIDASNGEIHVLNAPLIPPSIQKDVDALMAK